MFKCFNFNSLLASSHSCSFSFAAVKRLRLRLSFVRQPSEARIGLSVQRAQTLGTLSLGLTAAAAANTTSASKYKVACCKGLSTITPPQNIKLYQYQVCPFCNKVKAFLEYHSIPYELVEVNPLTKDEIKFSKYKMVPFALVDGKQVNGSGEIIEYLSEGTKFSVKENDENRFWCKWVDDHLVHLLPPNIYRTPSEALQSFEYITNNSNFSTLQKLSVRYGGAAIMFLVAKRAKKKYNINEPRQDLYSALEYWTTEGLIKRKTRFHGGNLAPDIADLTIYGVIRSIDGNYDTWFDLKAQEFQHSEEFWKWYSAMDELVKANQASSSRQKEST